MAIFFRLLLQGDKAKVLKQAVGFLQAGTQPLDSYAVDSKAFSQVPGSPFAYWASSNLLSSFASGSQLQTYAKRVCFGLSTKDDSRFLRLA